MCPRTSKSLRIEELVKKVIRMIQCRVDVVSATVEVRTMTS